jgi:hypothetical protein
VRLSAGNDRTSVSGLVGPPARRQTPAGAPRRLEDRRRDDVTAYGALTASLNLTPGTYRARVVAGKGYAAPRLAGAHGGTGVRRTCGKRGGVALAA